MPPLGSCLFGASSVLFGPPQPNREAPKAGRSSPHMAGHWRKPERGVQDPKQTFLLGPTHLSGFFSSSQSPAQRPSAKRKLQKHPEMRSASLPVSWVLSWAGVFLLCPPLLPAPAAEQTSAPLTPPESPAPSPQPRHCHSTVEDLEPSLWTD